MITKRELAMRQMRAARHHLLVAGRWVEGKNSAGKMLPEGEAYEPELVATLLGVIVTNLLRDARQNLEQPEELTTTTL